MRERFNEEIVYDESSSTTKNLDRKNLQAKSLEESTNKSNNCNALSVTKTNVSKRSNILKSIRSRATANSKFKPAETVD